MAGSLADVISNSLTGRGYEWNRRAVGEIGSRKTLLVSAVPCLVPVSVASRQGLDQGPRLTAGNIFLPLAKSAVALAAVFSPSTPRPGSRGGLAPLSL